VSSDGVALAVHDLGGQGPALVLAHATGFHGRVWDPLAGTLAPRFHCWSFDARGHGHSGRPEPPDFDWEGFGADVLAVVGGAGLDRPFGFGHSQGGTALLLAEQARPGTFAGLYLFEPVAWPGPMEMDDHPLVVGAERRRGDFASVEAARARLGSRPPLSELDPAVLRAYVDHGVVPAPGGGVRLACHPGDEARVYRQGVRHRAYARLGSVTCPVVIARGRDTQAVPAALARDQVRRLPRGRLEELDGLGHLGPLEDPARVAAAVAAALTA